MTILHRPAGAGPALSPGPANRINFAELETMCDLGRQACWKARVGGVPASAVCCRALGCRAAGTAFYPGTPPGPLATPLGPGRPFTPGAVRSAREAVLLGAGVFLIHALWCRQKEQGATQQEKNGFEADFQQQVLRRAPEGV